MNKSRYLLIMFAAMMSAGITVRAMGMGRPEMGKAEREDLDGQFNSIIGRVQAVKRSMVELGLKSHSKEMKELGAIDANVLMLWDQSFDPDDPYASPQRMLGLAEADARRAEKMLRKAQRAHRRTQRGRQKD